MAHIWFFHFPEKQYHLIILDVDSKDLSVGMSCPPKAFIEREFLREIDALIHAKGLLPFPFCFVLFFSLGGWVQKQSLLC